MFRLTSAAYLILVITVVDAVVRRKRSCHSAGEPCEHPADCCRRSPCSCCVLSDAIKCKYTARDCANPVILGETCADHIEELLSSGD
uniref:Gsp_13 putative toxin n=1 Tax=Gemmula speciosa TaxID=439592 RepID=A0A098LXU7_GEMSP